MSKFLKQNLTNAAAETGIKLGRVRQECQRSNKPVLPHSSGNTEHILIIWPRLWIFT